MSARFLVGDVHERMADMPTGSYDLIITSPPFLALRSYLPAGHPLKAQEIGSEATPAAFLDVMLALTAEWGRLLAPHGSIAIEMGDTYAGSGGAGGDYGEGGIRAGQPRFDGSKAAGDTMVTGQPRGPRTFQGSYRAAIDRKGTGWPLAKSLAMIPELYAASLAYGANLLTGEVSPAGKWRVRNFKPWIRSNPPVGALGDKERPATSYVTVATRTVSRYFDLDAVRTLLSENHARGHRKDQSAANPSTGWATDSDRIMQNQAGAPPLDWWHEVDAIIDAELDARAGKANGWSSGKTRTGKNDAASRGGNWSSFTPDDSLEARRGTIGARGVHIRRALERGGILATVDALDVSPKGYKDAHYAVWPPQLVKLLLQEMCPRRVCTTCGKPSRRITEKSPEYTAARAALNAGDQDSVSGRSDVAVGNKGHGFGHGGGAASLISNGKVDATPITVGWSDCGHDTWRPGRVLDPFVGSGTTLAVATGLGHDADGIDIDQRNAVLALKRVGPLLLDIDWPPPDFTLLALPCGPPLPTPPRRARPVATVAPSTPDQPQPIEGQLSIYDVLGGT